MNTLKAQSRRFILREQTAPAHALLDEQVGDFDDLASYRRYLRGMEAFRAPYEQALAQIQWPEIFGAWRPQRIADLLRADLADLETPSLPPMPAIKLEGNLEPMLGVLYVLEGSSLGARILRQRARKLDLTDTWGARHLARQASDTRNWAEFLIILEESPYIDIHTVCSASLTVFAAATKAFQNAADARHSQG